MEYIQQNRHFNDKKYNFICFFIPKKEQFKFDNIILTTRFQNKLFAKLTIQDWLVLRQTRQTSAKQVHISGGIFSIINVVSLPCSVPGSHFIFELKLLDCHQGLFK